jgi:hypothetical protein
VSGGDVEASSDWKNPDRIATSRDASARLRRNSRSALYLTCVLARSAVASVIAGSKT